MNVNSLLRLVGGGSSERVVVCGGAEVTVDLRSAHTTATSSSVHQSILNLGSSTAASLK